jgi:hypothetical protein
MAETTKPVDTISVVQAYHQSTKHRLDGYAAGPDTLDWDAQPDPFRRYLGAPLTELPLKADAVATRWAELFAPGCISTRALDRDALGLLFELSFALSAWKQHGPDRWAMRVNPSSGNLHPMCRWPIIDTVAEATRVHDLPPDAERTAAQALDRTAQGLPDLQRSTHNAAMLIRQRRSAQRFDARARMPLDQLWLLLRALHPDRLPFDAGPTVAHVHVLLFAHRVNGLAPGAYLLPRGASGRDVLRHSLPAALELSPLPGAPADAPLLRLAENPALAGTLRTLNCHQVLSSDAMLGFALLAEFNPLPDAAAYRERLQEAGLIGQVLYLEAEALQVRGTGIGCFFDDTLHQLIGLPDSTAASAPLQSVYHFTVGLPLSDARIATEPPYAHLSLDREGA